MKSDFSVWFKKLAIRERKRETWEFKRQKADSELAALRRQKREDTRWRKIAREQICVARGLTNCRKRREMSQTEFADFVEVSRRALVNYENGHRAVGSNVLEKILVDGQIGLHELFNVEPDPVPVENRRDIAKLTVDLAEACFAIYPKADRERVYSMVANSVAWWPKSRRTSSKNIENEAGEIIDSLCEEETFEDQDNNNC